MNKKLHQYAVGVSLCDGQRCGIITVEAESEEMAEEMVMNDVCQRLNEALPMLDIEVSVAIVDKSVKDGSF